MMKGQFREYSWKDIQRLIYADMGLATEEERRTRGDMWYVGGFKPLNGEDDFCVRAQVYDKPYSERLREHMGES